MAKMTGLGKGLDALFSDTKISELSEKEQEFEDITFDNF